jgi:hypothetical protein
MHRLFGFWIIFLLTFLPAFPVLSQTRPQPAKPVKPETVVVFDLIAEKDVQKGAANLLTEVVLDYAAKLGKYEVMGQKDLFKILNWEQQKQLQGCTDTGCLVNLAGAMGAKYIVEGSLGISSVDH